jgi:hypothetical protein
MIPESQYILRSIIRWLAVALAVIATVVLVGLLQQKNMWVWIVAYWSVLTLKTVLECFKW